MELAGDGKVLARLVEALEHVYRRRGGKARKERRLFDFTETDVVCFISVQENGRILLCCFAALELLGEQNKR